MGFWEFIVIAIVGTIVLGPDKLPGALRKIVQWKRKLSQMAQSVSAEVNEQLRVHELHNNLKEAEKKGFENLSPELQRSVDELYKAANSVNPDTPAKPEIVEPQSKDGLENKKTND
ncbi:twin-arginine translocase subunit TatB [Psychrosphaera ytuae]|uniref:Twin-arginine translocase subunit TatB n=1 Tax=Psychrosphaera ytuae TaxID=2820710 RepID=A0A975DA34_9GAMM|nr:twin-arginine translocase subunit TatB [Psychrosphaera ytuae]